MRKRQFAQLELALGQSNQAKGVKKSKKAQKTQEIDRIFDEYLDWVQDTMTTEKKPYIQVVAVLTRQKEDGNTITMHANEITTYVGIINENIVCNGHCNTVTHISRPDTFIEIHKCIIVDLVVPGITPYMYGFPWATDK